MSYLFKSQLTEEEVEYICTVIPVNKVINYFRKNPKEFTKILPGFRPTSITKTNASRLLYRYHNRDFIAYFLDMTISIWLEQIQKDIKQCIDDGKCKYSALLNTLPDSYFLDNIGLYFKLVKENYTEEYISLMGIAAKQIKEITEEKKKLSVSIGEIGAECKELKEDLNNKEIELEQTKENLKKSARLKGNIKNLRKEAKKDKEKIKILLTEKDDLLDQINSLSNELDEEKNSNIDLQKQVKNEIKKNNNEEALIPMPSLKRPCSLEEFTEFLGYNLIDIGVHGDKKYLPLLKSYISKIAFRGIPIVVNHAVGMNIIKCISNTLIGTSTIKILSYRQDIGIDEIRVFISSSDRIVCLDNFLGNFNETELIPLVERYSDKMIFLTAVYDKTLRYISSEFLRYCSYFNASRIGVLSFNKDLSEDPSEIKEHSYKSETINRENRYQKILRQLLYELNYPHNIIEYKCELISSEQDLCELLAFDLLPYCVDVMGINPYNTSEQLLRYAGDKGRCPYKNLLLGWFG